MLPQHEIDEAQRTALELSEQPKSAPVRRRWIPNDPAPDHYYELSDGVLHLVAWSGYRSVAVFIRVSDLMHGVVNGMFREIGPEVKTPGLRCVCQHCSTDLLHSDRKGHRISHGQCNPACAQTPEEWRKVIEQIS